jgi:hypothetical protein
VRPVGGARGQWAYPTNRRATSNNPFQDAAIPGNQHKTTPFPPLQFDFLTSFYPLGSSLVFRKPARNVLIAPPMSDSQPTTNVKTGSKEVYLSCRMLFEVMDRLDSLKPSDCLPQKQSPLFSVLPAEIRSMVFLICLAEQDGKTEMGREQYFYRPGYTYYRFIDTALVRVCRRIYLETRTIPMQNVTFRDWLGSVNRQPPRGACYHFSVRLFS